MSALPTIFAARRQAGLADAQASLELVALAGIQTLVVFGLAAFFGLWAAAKAGLPGAPMVIQVAGGPKAPPLGRALLRAAVLGIFAGIAVVGCDVVLFQPQVSFRPSPIITDAFWSALLTGLLYGGVNEEVMTRLFVVSGIIFLVGLVVGPERARGAGVGWVAIAIAAILFAAGHLPITGMMTALTPLIVLRAIVLNGIIGILCGWLFLRRGLECSIVAHAAAHLPIQLGAALFA